MTEEQVSTAAHSERRSLGEPGGDVGKADAGSFLDSVWQDIRFGLRLLRTNPTFAVVAVLTLALGIGANTAIFSLLDPLLLRSLPVRSPDELVLIRYLGSLGSLDVSPFFSLRRYRENNQVFSGLLAFAPIDTYDVHRNGRSTPTPGELVSGNYFTLLGVRASSGRLLLPDDEETPSGGSVVVLSSDYWRKAFGSDPAAVGETMSIGASSYTIVGIAPAGFFGTEVGKSPDFYLPFGKKEVPADAWVTILARLGPGVSLARAQANLEPLLRGIAAETLPAVEIPENMAHLALVPAAHGVSDLRERFSLPARVLMGVVAVVLLIASANVANLLLTQAVRRKREITVRLALGAPRRRLVRQLLTESLLLAGAGTVCGLVLGTWASRLLVASLSTAGSQVVLASGINGRVVLFAAGVLGFTVLLCALAPAFSATRLDLAHDLKVQSASTGRTSLRSKTGKILLVTQVALSIILLSGGGLLLHSLVNLETFDVGFDRDNVLAVSMEGRTAGISPDQLQAFDDRLLGRVANLPGVRSASLSDFTPISGREFGINIVIDGSTINPGESTNIHFVRVSSGYFQTMGIPILRGREFTQSDVRSPARVALINRTMARRFFGDASPLGAQIKFTEGRMAPVEIIGIVADSKYNDMREKSLEFFYLPGGGRVLEVRASGNATMLAGLLRDTIKSLDSSITIGSMKTLRAQIDESLHQDRLISALCGAFSLLALTLTCVGLYGTLSFNIARRTGEIGLRMALGANPSDIFTLVLGQGMMLVVIGIFVGTTCALASASVLAKMLFGVKQYDPITFVGASLVLVAAALLACYVPARRATRVDPIVALRYE